MTLHDGEVHTDAALVEALVASQFPELAGPVRAFSSSGTVNAIYRIGDTLYARLPRLEHFARDLQREREWLPRLAPSLPLRVPEPVAFGRPGHGYPYEWAIFRWLEGAPYAGTAAEHGGAAPGGGGAAVGGVAPGGGGAAVGGVAPGGGGAAANSAAPGGSGATGGGDGAAADGVVTDERVAAAELARFVRALRAVTVPNDAPRGGRRPLRELDAMTRDAIARSRDLIDAPAALRAWERAREVPPFTGTPVWIHCDLLRPNLLVSGGRLSAVIDFGGIGAGDPAADVIAAWAVFGSAGRAAFRAALDVDDDTWARARGFALHQAAMIVPYYVRTNPAFTVLAQRTIAMVLEEQDLAADRHEAGGEDRA